MAALVAVPVLFMLARGLLAGRNVAYADDIDGTLMLLLQLQDGGWWSDVFNRLLEVSNEHRMVTSRVLVVVSYWLSDTVNFEVFGVIGNLFICGACALLVRAAGEAERKWTMALVLAALLFQLEHFENFFWSGASIDHFQIVLLAGAALVLLARGSWLGCGAAAFFGLLATFTLAHGTMVWPVGAVLLAAQRRWRHLALWLMAGAAVGYVFFLGYEFNPAHRIGDVSSPDAGQMLRYWLELIGAPLALGQRALAPWLGAILVGWIGWQLGRGGLRRERIALPLALWALGSLALVAIGRANVSGGVLGSRYLVLAALAWAMAIFVELQFRHDATRPYRALRWAIPALALFNLAANIKFADEAKNWVAQRDSAVAAFVAHGRDGTAPAKLHPQPEHATRVLREAETAGVFMMPRQSVERVFANVRESAGIVGAIDRISVQGNLVVIDGWAAMPGREAKDGAVHLVLRSADAQRVLTTTTVSRPDLTAAFPRENWARAGFHFELRRWLLPEDSYQVGYLLPGENGAELTMTPQRLELGNGAYTLDVDKVDPNRAVFDELRIYGTSATITAAPNKVMRVVFVDNFGVLVNADFRGAGRLTIELPHSELIKVPGRDAKHTVRYRKGLAALSIGGADRTTSLSVYAARRQLPGHNNANWGTRNDTAHIASISIASRDGRFGALRTGNVNYVGREGIVGVHAPDTVFTGFVNLGDIQAFGKARPELRFGGVREARVTGGDLFQPNGRAVEVSGIAQLKFVEGRTAHGVRLPARRNRALLESDGRDVSAELTRELPQLAQAANRTRAAAE
jgi:hypothetical protein